MSTKKLEEMTKDELITAVKHLKKNKKYGLVWEEKPEGVVEQCHNEIPVLEEVKNRVIEKDPNGPTNLIIEGDNYHALSVLNYTHSGKVDVIYIDPPYNTGAKNWKYNNNFVDKEDAFRHSKWLSLMEHRLTLAKKLLKKDGVLICAIDDNEQSHLNVLIEELFKNYEQHNVIIVHNPKGIQGKNFSYIHEYAIFVLPKNIKIVSNRKLEEAEMYVSNLRNWGNESLRTDAKNCFYPIIIKNNKIIGFGDVASDNFHPSSPNETKNKEIYIWPIDDKGIERKWRYARQSVEKIKDILKIKSTKKGNLQILIAKDYGIYKTVWSDKKYDGSEYGTKLLRKILPGCDFDFPKSIYTVFDCLYAILGSRPNSLVLDFFAGSGTTGHAVMMLNREDGGNRQFILCTNNENEIAEKVCYPRIEKVIKGVKSLPEITGIPSNLRYFKTSFVQKSKVSDDTRWKLVKRSTEMICIRENTYEKIIDDPDFKIYKNNQHTTGILFNLDKIDTFKDKLIKQKMPSNIYVFSLTNDTFSEDFDDLEIKHELCPIPESILEVYKKLFHN